MAARVKAAKDDGTFDQKTAQTDLDQHIEEYEFGVRRSRGPADPVEREALIMAKDMVKQALRAKGFKIADLDSNDITTLAEQAIVANSAIMKQAKARVAERAKLVLPDLDLTKIQPEEAA